MISAKKKRKGKKWKITKQLLTWATGELPLTEMEKTMGDKIWGEIEEFSFGYQQGLGYIKHASSTT